MSSKILASPAAHAAAMRRFSAPEAEPGTGCRTVVIAACSMSSEGIDARFRKTLELVNGLRPVDVEQPRKGAIGEQLAPGLASRAVICLVVGVDDALHGRAAVGAGEVVPAVDGHLGTEGRDLLREAAAGLGAEALDPLVQ